MRWCCTDLKQHLQHAGEKGFGVVYVDFAKVGRFFLFHYREGEPRSESPPAIRIRFCPWCGANLDEFPL